MDYVMKHEMKYGVLEWDGKICELIQKCTT